MTRDLQIAKEVERQLSEFGSLISTGTPATPALATPTGFGLVEVEFSEGAPIALNKSSLRRMARTSDVANNTAVFVTSGLTLGVAVGDSWIVRGALYVGSAAVTGGLQLKIVAPAFTAGRLGVFGPRAGGAFQQNVTIPPVASATYCNFDCSANDALIFVEAYFENFTAAGTIDLQFAAAVGGENWILRQNSWLLGIRD